MMNAGTSERYDVQAKTILVNHGRTSTHAGVKKITGNKTQTESAAHATRCCSRYRHRFVSGGLPNQSSFLSPGSFPSGIRCSITALT